MTGGLDITTQAATHSRTRFAVCGEVVLRLHLQQHLGQASEPAVCLALQPATKSESGGLERRSSATTVSRSHLDRLWKGVCHVARRNSVQSLEGLKNPTQVLSPCFCSPATWLPLCWDPAASLTRIRRVIMAPSSWARPHWGADATGCPSRQGTKPVFPAAPPLSRARAPGGLAGLSARVRHAHRRLTCEHRPLSLGKVAALTN
jgi:hypothetical protein